MSGSVGETETEVELKGTKSVSTSVSIKNYMEGISSV